MDTFEKLYNMLPGSGWLSKPEAKLLWETAKDLPGDILEVGCFQGRSTCLLASFGRQVHAVDPFERFDSDDPTGLITLSRFRENIKSRSLVNVCWYKMRIEEWQPIPVGFTYLDGDHTFIGTIVQVQKALLCKSPVIAIHDVNDSGGGLQVRKAAEMMLGPWIKRVERLAVWQRSI